MEVVITFIPYAMYGNLVYTDMPGHQTVWYAVSWHLHRACLVSSTSWPIQYSGVLTWHLTLPNHKDIDATILEWFRHARSKNIPVHHQLALT